MYSDDSFIDDSELVDRLVNAQDLAEGIISTKHQGEPHTDRLYRIFSVAKTLHPEHTILTL
jgi:hypothetical protein